MFESIQRGFGFVSQALNMARQDGDLIKPTLYSMVVGGVASLVGGIPLILIALFVGGSDFGNLIVGVLGAGLIFVQYAIAYIFSGMTAYLVYGSLAEGDGRMDKAWEVVKRDWLDLLSLAAASTVVKVVENFIRGSGRRRNPLGEMLAGLLNSVWTSATYFVLPAMVIEDLSLSQGLQRATAIVKKNLLLVAVTEIGVSGVIGFVGGLLGVLAVLLGVGIFFAFAALAGENNVILWIIGGVAGAVTAGGLLAVINGLASYVMTAYHTCMFLWARGAEQAVANGQNAQSAAVPAPVAAVLGLAGR